MNSFRGVNIMRTSPRVEIRNFKMGFDKFNGGYEARTLDTVLVKVVWMSAVRGYYWIVHFSILFTHLEVITHTTPKFSNDSSSRLKIIASAISVTYIPKIT